MELPFGQTFSGGDIALIGLLIVLEGVLSIDNALVLGLLARKLPKIQQGRALTYGLIGAFVFRFIAITMAQALMRWTWVKLLGGFYLLYVSFKYFVLESGPEEQPAKLGASSDDAVEHKEPEYAALGPTIAAIALTDVSFAVDSILSALALVGDPPPTGLHPKLWVVVSGGLLGMIMMRYAAVVFIKLLTKFPRFEVAAYVLVAVIGVKLVLDYVPDWFPWTKTYLNFHSPSSPAFWVFWVSMIAAFCLGFIPPKAPAEKESDAASTPAPENSK